MLQLMLFQFGFALAVLVLASILDLRSREISNWLWVVAYPVGCILAIVGVATGSFPMETVILSLGFSLVIGWVLFYFGFYGGADVKALIFVGLAIPVFPFVPILGVSGFPPVLTMFCNSVFLSMICPLSVLALNIRDNLRGTKMFEGINVTIREKAVLLFTARKIKLERLERNLAYFPSETVINQNGKPTRKLLHFVKAEADLSKSLNAIKENMALYADGVLASPTIPFIVFFTVGLAIVPLGNLVIWVISCLLNSF
jgi:preflagellin peptidase FlaK